MAQITPIGDMDEFFETTTRQREAADQRVEPWQNEMKAGDHFVRIVVASGRLLVIYGVIEELKYEEDQELHDEPHMKHFRFCRCYSVACPEGELGDVHVSVMQKKLSPTQFKAAQEMGWPSDSRLRDIVELS